MDPIMSSSAAYFPIFKLLKPTKKLELSIIGIISSFLGCASPVVKFRFTPEQINEDFNKNQDRKPILYAKKDIGVTHVEITGSLIQGINSSVFTRIYHKPTKFLYGCVQLVAAVGLTCIYCNIATASPLLNSILAVVSESMKHHQTMTKVALGVLHISTW
jgi:hypothetical protein